MWLELHIGSSRNRKIRRLARDLNIQIPQTIGHLVLLWTSVMEQSESGDITKWTKGDIAEYAGYTGDAGVFYQALKGENGEGLIDEIGGRVIVHNWWKYAGRYLTSKYHSCNPGRLAEIKSALGVTEGNPIGGLKAAHRLPKGEPPNPPDQQNQTDQPLSAESGKPRVGHQKPEITPSRPAKETWLTPYNETWKKHMGGDMPFARAAKALQAINADPGPDRVCKVLAWYLLHTEARYISIEGFAGKWKKIEREMIAKKGGSL